MMNFGKMMKQAQELQTKMAQAQAEVEKLEAQGQAGAGLVEVILSGKHEMKGLKIDPSLLKEEEADMLEDLIVAAYNDAKSKVDAAAGEKMESVTGGLNLPAGMKLPF